jgi:uncharacterized protein (DUF305 family)
MQKRTTVFAILVILLVVAIALIKGSYSHKIIDSSVDSPDGAIKIYLEAMIPHHQEAVDASLRIIQDPTLDDPELRIMASRIFDAQTFEIVQMRSWYSDWFGTAYNASTTLWKGTYMPMMIKTRAATEGAELKKAYLKEMIAHHKMALAMSEEAKKATLKFQKNNAASDGNLTITDANPVFEQATAFMQRVIDAQSREIEQLSSLQD